MGLGDVFIRLFSQEKKEENTISRIDPPLVCMGRGAQYELLSEIATLRDASVLVAKGTWRPEDFLTLKEKIRDGLLSTVANVVLREVDMGEVKFDSGYDMIDFRKLFNYCVSLTTVFLPDASSYEGSVSFCSTFIGCSKLKELHNLSTYRHISDLKGTFCYCTLLSEVRLFSVPLPQGDSDTFQKVNRNIRVIVPEGTRIPSSWSQLNPDNVFYEDTL